MGEEPVIRGRSEEFVWIDEVAYLDGEPVEYYEEHPFFGNDRKSTAKENEATREWMENLKKRRDEEKELASAEGRLKHARNTPSELLDDLLRIDGERWGPAVEQVREEREIDSLRELLRREQGNG